jgi:hypothetical protein
MKLRHAAALGLVVWYLMLPPNAAVRDISIPLAQWSVEGTLLLPIVKKQWLAYPNERNRKRRWENWRTRSGKKYGRM